MSEYTPTTAEIVNAWRYFRTENRDFDGDAEAEVRSWLAAHDAEVRASVVPEIGMPCADTKPHPAHAWQMSATGFCLCAGVVAEEPELSAEEMKALEAVRGWTRSSGPGVRVLRVLLAMAERAVYQGEPSDAQVRSIWDALGPSVTVHLDFEDLRSALLTGGGVR